MSVCSEIWFNSTPTVTRGSVEINADSLHRGSEIGQLATIAAIIKEVEGADYIFVLAAGLRECLAGDMTGLAVLDGYSLDASEDDNQSECRSGEMHVWNWEVFGYKALKRFYRVEDELGGEKEE